MLSLSLSLSLSLLWFRLKFPHFPPSDCSLSLSSLKRYLRNQIINLFKLDDVRNGCPVSRARGSCIKRPSIPDRTGISKCFRRRQKRARNIATFRMVFYGGAVVFAMHYGAIRFYELNAVYDRQNRQGNRSILTINQVFWHIQGNYKIDTLKLFLILLCI